MAYDRLHQKLETKEGEKEVFKLVRARERRTRDLDIMMYIKDENDRVLCEDVEIKQRWQTYFSKLLNGEMMEDFRSRSRESSESQLDHRFCEPISKDEIKESLRKMTNEKVEGPDQIPVEVWKCLDEKGLKWLAELFDVIFWTAKMPREWSFSTVIPLYNNRGDIQDCNNYRGIKLLSHAMKL